MSLLECIDLDKDIEFTKKTNLLKVISCILVMCKINNIRLILL